MGKIELLTKGNQLVEKLNEAMANIEVIDIAKEQVAMDAAELCVNIHHEDSEVMDIYEFKKVLGEKSLEKIKAFIMTELDMAQQESMRFLEQIGVTVTTPEGDTYNEIGEDDAENFEVIEEPPVKVKDDKPIEQTLMELSAEGKTCEEIAAITGIPRSTVWYKLDKLKKEGAKRGKR